MGECDMKKWIYAPVAGIAIGELLMLYDKILSGLGLHIINLLAMILIIIFGNLSPETKNILQSLILLPLLRIINISTPPLFTDIYLQYLLTYGIMLVPIYSIAKSQQMSFKKLETNFGRFYVYIFTITLIWVVAMMIEQYMNIVSNMQTIELEYVSIYEDLMTFFLIVLLLISLLISDTKYWNKYSSNTLRICNNSLLLTFVTMVIYRTMVII